jgi:hypothetical protein
MSFGHRDGVIRRGTGWVILVGAVSVALAAMPGAALAARPSAPRARAALERGVAVPVVGAAARGTPSEVIDANTDPQQAGQAMNSGCANLVNCSWSADGPPTIAYGPPSILGDALYNCSDAAYAETAVGVSDERGESTSISESLSVEVGLGFLGFEQSTAEFKVFSKQSESFSTTVSAINAVAVPPMWKGWTETELLTASVTGDAYITAGIDKLIEVKNIDLSFPGYRDPNDTTDNPVKYIGYRTPMTAQDIASRCSAISGLGGAKHAPTGSFQITFCHPVSFTATAPRDPADACETRKVTGTPPPSIARAAVTLVRADRTYATGTDTGGVFRLTPHRPIRRGRYTLDLRQPLPPAPQAGRRTQSSTATIVPIAIG